MPLNKFGGESFMDIIIFTPTIGTDLTKFYYGVRQMCSFEHWLEENRRLG
jgi:hypothetical protein